MQGRGELEIAKREIVRRIESLPEDYEFAVIFFDRGLLEYPEDGTTVRATPEEKLAATDWIASVLVGRGTCPKEALSAALTTLGQSAAVGKRIIYLGDGGAHCGAAQVAVMANTLDAVAAQNTEGVIIHAVFYNSETAVSTVRGDFLQALVDASGGLLVEIVL